MEIIKGKALPSYRVFYNFDILQHGDAIRVNSQKSAADTFRKWRISAGRPNTRLVASTREGEEDLAFFIETAGRVRAPKQTPIADTPVPRNTRKPVSEDEI